MKNPEHKIENILYIVDSIIHCDNDRNYGDRDIYIHKLKNAWESFIEENKDNDCPYLYKRKENNK